MVRTAVEGDRARLAEIDRVSWSVESTPAQLPMDAAWVDDVDLNDVLVVEHDGVVAGYLLVGQFAPTLPSARGCGVLRSLAVHPKFRGFGLARRLLDMLRDLATERGWQTTIVNVLATNGPAIAVYRAAGFQPSGHVRGLFCINETWVDDYQLQLDLRAPAEPAWLEGGCHCGNVQFRVFVRAWEVIDCNCSICTKKGIAHLIVEREDFELLTPQSAMSTYTFNTHQAQHHFCARCGIHPFYIPRSHPNSIDVNARTLDGGDPLARFVVRPFDGRNWEENVEKIR